MLHLFIHLDFQSSYVLGTVSIPNLENLLAQNPTQFQTMVKSYL